MPSWRWRATSTPWQAGGTFVAEGQEQNLVRRREVEDKVRPLLQELRELGMTEGEWIALWRGGNENA